MLSAKFSCQPNVLTDLAFLFPILLRSNKEGYEYRGECSLHSFIDGEAVVEVRLFRVGDVSGMKAHVFHISREFDSRRVIFY